MNMNNDDVYKKYSVTNGDWSLAHEHDSYAISLGQLLRGVYKMHENLFIPAEILVEIHKCDNIKCYYYRNVITRDKLEKLFCDVNKSIRHNNLSVLDVYNSDPWGRKFPLFFNGKAIDVYDGRASYSYKIFYGHRVVSRDKINYNIYGHPPIIDENSVPKAVLHTSTLDGVVIGCLDLLN